MKTVVFLASCLAAIAASAQTYTWTATILYTDTPAFAYAASFGRQFGSIMVYGNNFANERATGWNGTAASLVMLNPDNAEESRIHGAFGSYRAGWMTLTHNVRHATVWTGNSTSVVDLNGSFTGSSASSVSAEGIAGWGFVSGPPSQPHTLAILWRGSATNYVDLTPPGASAMCFGASDGSQVGELFPTPMHGGSHPCLWHSTAASMVNLSPTTSQGRATGVDGNTQVGYVYNKAYLWHGTAKSMTSLHPADALSSQALGVKGGYQVGWASFRLPDRSVNTHAIIWTGSADTALDLHQYLPAEYTKSVAYGVTTFARRIRDFYSTKMYARFEINVVGYALRPGGHGADAVVWKLVGSTSEIKKPTVPVRIKTPRGTIRKFVIDLTVKMREEIPKWKLSPR